MASSIGGTEGLQTQVSGMLTRWTNEFCARLCLIQEALELDELDRMARRYARSPGAGAALALVALATVAEGRPDLLKGAEVNLAPERLMALADRQQALSVLGPMIDQLSRLIADTSMELGDELVELLTVGWSRVQKLQEEEALPPRLGEALQTLSDYHERAQKEGAHRSAKEREQIRPR